jgi:hypothetical protein
MSTLTPLHLTEDGTFQSGVAPTYLQSATATSLTIVGEPNQPSSVGTHNNTIFPPLAGDFTASVSVDMTLGAGGFFNPSTPTRYFGVGFSYGVGTNGNYGMGLANVNTPTIPSLSPSMDFTLARCLVPGFDGASLSNDWKDALWARFFMGAPRRQGSPSSDTT